MVPLQEPIAVDELDLDPQNPRLPEEVQGSAQSEILEYLWENDVLEELIDSYLANGYFQSESVIALPPVDGRRVVVEGNRRLAALMILHQLPPAVDAGIELEPEEIPTAEQLAAVSSIPVVEAASAEDVSAFLGFRHISGLKRWGPEAKARWLFLQVELRAPSESDRGVFFDVGRRVGSNARGVRSAYIAYGILRHARDVLKLDRRVLNFVSRERFGVWTRLLGTANATLYIGMGDKVSNEYQSLRLQIENIDPAALLEVLEDLTPPAPRQRAILGDSRDVTDYSDVLAVPAARIAMRDFGSLALGVEIAREGALEDRLAELTRSIDILTTEVRRYVIGDAEVEAARELAAAAISLRGAVASAAAGEDEV